MPTTTGKATEFITFSRTSNATVTDSDGKIKWAPHNLLLASEQFDAASWTKAANVTVTANAGAAPNGTTTADRVATSGAAGAVSQTLSLAVGEKYKISLWAKSFGGSSQTFRLFGDTGILSSDLTATSSWQLFEFEFTVATGGSRICGMTANAAFGNYDVLVWGASLYRSDLGGMKANTSAYPMYNPTTAKNLLGYTEDFSNAAWSKSNTSAPGTTIVAPNGLQTADLFVSASGTTGGSTFQSGGPTWSSNSMVLFNLSTGTVGTVTAGSFTSTSITSVGDGWYRCAAVKDGYTLSFYGKAGAWSSVALQTFSTEKIRLYPSTSSTAQTGTGDGVSGVYLWGAQLSDSASLDAYVPNNGPAPTAAAYYGPRLDFDGATLAAKGLLVEESRVNLFQYSDQFDNAYWTKNGLITAGMANAAVAPTGTSVADAITEDTSTGVHRVFSTHTLAVATYTISFYAKANGRQWLYIYVDAGINAGTLNFVTNTYVPSTGTPTVSSVPVGNGWYRVTFTFSNTTTTSQNLQIWLAANGTTNSYTGDGTSGIYLFGAQLEAGSFATSYIPNVNTIAGVTRNPDVATVGTNQFPYSATEGTLVVNVTKDFLGGDAVSAALYLTSVSNTMELYFNSADSRLFAATGGSTQVNLIDTGKVVAGATTKAGFAYAANNYALSTNGGAILPATSATVPPVATLGIGSRGGGLPFRGWIRQITYIPRRLTNAELQARTV